MPDVNVSASDDIRFEGPLHAVFGDRLLMQIPHADFYEEGCNYTFRLEPYTYRTQRPPAKFMTNASVQNYRWTTTFPEFQYYELSGVGSSGGKSYDRDIVEGIRVEKTIYEPAASTSTASMDAG
jgi:hypothetical protein